MTCSKAAVKEEVPWWTDMAEDMLFIVVRKWRQREKGSEARHMLQESPALALILQLGTTLI